jgi:hypothetical protein
MTGPTLTTPREEQWTCPECKGHFRVGVDAMAHVCGEPLSLPTPHVPRPGSERAMTEPTTDAPLCGHEYTRPGGRQHGDRILRCDVPQGHVGPHMEIETESTWPRAYTAPGWPPISERDEHLGAWAADRDAFETIALGVSDKFRTYELAADTTGLTAAQEIRLRLIEAALGGDVDLADPDETVRDLGPLAAWVEHGPDEMPIPLKRQVADLVAERKDDHARLADLDRSRDRWKGEALRWRLKRDAVLAVLDNAPFAYDDLDAIRAIFAEHGDEPSKADILFADGTHRYWSTHCRHGHHNKCAATSFPGGGKRNPSQCKTEECQAPCRCECHAEHGDEVGGDG